MLNETRVAALGRRMGETDVDTCPREMIVIPIHA